MTADELKSQLLEEELIDDQPWPVPEPGTPWYIQLLSAFGAWFATLFLLIFWLFMGGREDSPAWFLEGLGQAVVAIFLLRLSKSDLIVQPSLALWTTGTGLASFGAAQAGGTGFDRQGAWVGALTLAVFSLFYPQFLGRLVSLLGAGWWLLLAVCEFWRESGSADGLVIALSVAGGLIWLGQEAIWRRGRFWGEMVRPYGLATFVLLLELLVFNHWKITSAPLTWATSAIITAMVLWLAARVTHKLQLTPAGGAWALGSVLAVGAVTYSAPGIMAALGVVLVGFCVRERLLEVLGGGFLLGFVVNWYDSITLGENGKASLLILLGAVLLGLRKILVALK